jgi:hypothetical protein
MGRVRRTRHIPRLKMKNGQHLWTGANCFYSAKSQRSTFFNLKVLIKMKFCSGKTPGQLKLKFPRIFAIKKICGKNMREELDRD